MITQEIKLYDEPKPVPYTGYQQQQLQKKPDLGAVMRRDYYYKCTQDEVDDAVAEAQVLCGVKIGDKFRFIYTNFYLTVIGFANKPHDVSYVYSKPAVVLCERYNAAGEKVNQQPQYYSTYELFEQDYLEPM